MKRIIPLIFVFLLVATALADGGYFPPPDYPQMYEPTQEAIVLHNGYRETLIIKPSFSGDAGAFAWVVPVPAYPEVTESDRELFRELYQLTSPQYIAQSSVGFGGAMMATAESKDVGIYFHERKQVGIYDTVIMSGWDENNFMWWFEKEGFSIPESAKPIIKEYMNKNWIFVVMKIEKSEYEGEIEPVQFEFDSPNPMYPLRISSVNKGASEIRLYSFTQHRMSEPGFEVEYASRIEPEEIIHRYPKLNQLLDRGYFLTRMERTMWPAEMTYDIVLEEDVTVDPWTGQPNSEEYVPVRERPFDWGGLILLNIFAIPFLFVTGQIFRAIFNRVGKKKRKLSIARALGYSVVLAVLLNLVLYSGSLGQIFNALISAPFELLETIYWVVLVVFSYLSGLFAIALGLAVIAAIFYAVHWLSVKLLK